MSLIPTSKPGRPLGHAKSAYQIWLESGNSGTKNDFINSLKGQPGKRGLRGSKGTRGPAGLISGIVSTGKQTVLSEIVLPGESLDVIVKISPSMPDTDYIISHSISGSSSILKNCRIAGVSSRSKTTVHIRVFNLALSSFDFEGLEIDVLAIKTTAT